MYKNGLKDSLYNLSEKAGSNPFYCQGIVIGVVSVLMEKMSFEKAIEKVKNNLPDDYRLSGIPSSWREFFRDKE